MAEVQADVEATRAELGATVDELAHRADVKARAGEKADEIKTQTKAKVQHAGHVVAEQVETAGGIAKDAAGHRSVQIAVGAAVVLVVLLIRRARRS